ncbi:MAG: HlyD family efflux transporter periplasmic adaptor subunit [Taibaiella sp.]|nr:HlyD family efflux transporter periplasmic adaptor subunit [Taibaiella sp.]
MQLFLKQVFAISCILFLFAACKSNSKTTTETETKAETATPVTVTSVSSESLVEYIDLNATSAFLQKNYVKAITSGYIHSVNTQVGKNVHAGETLFVLKTKESQSIGNVISKLDPSFKFSGANLIKAPANGFITQLNHQLGDYVQDGEQLAIISDINSFAFILNLPYEFRSYITNQKSVDVILPDSTRLKGVITSSMPTVDPQSQTQSIVIKVQSANAIPENLIAHVRIIKKAKVNALSLPRSAVLTNDIQSDFWVMKMIDSNTAVKVPVKTGIATKDNIEILSPSFSPEDKIIVTGNYGLPDTAKVKIAQ